MLDLYVEIECESTGAGEYDRDRDGEEQDVIIDAIRKKLLIMEFEADLDD